jgi:hypothetical protein
MSSKLWCGAFAAAIALGSVGQAGAAIMLGAMHEPFDYADATQFGANSANNGGQGWNATGTTLPNAAGSNWGATGIPAAHAGAATLKTATTPGLTSTATSYLAASGNKITLDAAATNQSQSIARSLGGQSINAGSLYFSFLTDKNTDTQRTTNLAFFNTPSSERLAIGQFSGTNTTAGNIGVLFLNNNATGLRQTAGTPIPYGVGVTHLIVGRIDFDFSGVNERLTLWVDPTDVTTEAAAGAFYIQNSEFDLAAITTVRPFSGNTAAGFNAISADYDEIRLGGNWASVTTDAVPAIPEPATGLLLALGGAALAAMRKKR